MSVEHVLGLSKGARLNQYELQDVLGAGGFGITYMAHDTTLDTTVAIKEYMPGELATRLDDSSITPRSTTTKGDFDWGLRRFVDEARVLAKFRHPHIVRVNQIFEANNTAYLVMEYAKGETLDAVLRRAKSLTEQQTKDYLLPILDGLKRVHALGFLHRDIKPGNIIIRDDGGAVLIDFGAAREATGSKTRAITSIVTEGYAPLEQYDATGNQGAWTDLYAIGAVAYKCLTGNKPPSATSRVRNDPLVPLAVAVPGQVSPEFAGAIEMALRVHENERPQSINEFLDIVAGKIPVRIVPVAADATVALNLDATRVLQSASSVKLDPPVSATSSVSIKPEPPSALAVSANPEPVAQKPVIVAPPAKRSSAVPLGLAAVLLLGVAAGGWFYVQNGKPAVTGTDARVAEAAPAPAVTPAPAPSATTTPAPVISVPPPSTPPPATAAVTPPPAPTPALAAPPPSAPAGAPPAATPVPAPTAPPTVTASAAPPAPAPASAPPPKRAEPAPAQPRAAPNAIPPLPATPAKAIPMLRNFSDPVLKATLAQPGLRGRVETLLGLEGCDWRVNAAVAGQATTRQAGTYLNGMNDDNLRETLTDNTLLDRIDTLFGRASCSFGSQPQGDGTEGFPAPKSSNRNSGQEPFGGQAGPNPYQQAPGRNGIPGGYGGFNP